MAFAVPLALSAATAAGGVALPWLTAAGSLGSIAGAGGIAGGIASAGLGLSSISSFIGPAFSLLGGLQESRAEQEAYDYNIALHNYNAEIAERNARLAIESAELAAEEERRDTRRRLGTIRSRFGKAGVVTTSGSPLLALEEQAAEGRLEALKILFDGDVAAFGHKSEASIQRLKAGFEQRKKKSAKSEDFLGFGGKILTGTGFGSNLLG